MSVTFFYLVFFCNNHFKSNALRKILCTWILEFCTNLSEGSISYVIGLS